MKIAFFTEMGFDGKISRTHENMRTEFSWMCALDAEHHSIHLPPIFTEYDLGIIIIPKKDPKFDINRFKQCCKIAVMQEGPNWFYQDYSLEQQIWYFNTLTQADIIYTHNEIDKKYYSGLTNHQDVRVMQSLMIEEAIGVLPKVERKGVIIGGNFVSWYGGFDSFIIAQEMDGGKVTAPSMGRKQPGEEELLTHLPYLNWKEWIHKLNEFKYGVHLMRTFAAGTFALNCSYLGIPCIGYGSLDTQLTLHPSLSIANVGDLETAKFLAERLKTEEDFYNKCSIQTKELYNEHYTEKQFLTKFNKKW